MRRWRIFICILLIMAMIPALLWAQRCLPVRERKYIAKRYAGWNGVLRTWVCCEWSCASGFNGWLNKCAASFEKQNSGVYIEFEVVTKETMKNMRNSGLNLPDLIIFSAGLLESTEGILPMDCGVSLRGPLSSTGGGYALPIAMGGYILAKVREDIPVVIAPEDGRFNYSAALIALSEEAPPEIEAPETRIDLGLPASSAVPRFTLNRSETAIGDFIDGEAGTTIVDQNGLARLNALRDAGRGPEWSISESGRYAFTDQLLMCAVIRTDRSDFASRSQFAAAFAQSLLTAESQQLLSSTGAFSVLSERVYADTSVYAPMERLLLSRTLIIPECFHSRKPDLSLLADKVANGELSPEAAGTALAAAYGNQDFLMAPETSE